MGKKPVFPSVIIQLFERHEGWSTVWTTPYENTRETKRAVMYALDKLLDGSDADAFRVTLSNLPAEVWHKL